jgi:site-specific DNA-methyltransferase (adenine-specific)
MEPRKEIIGNCELYLCDCMKLMPALPDKSINLAIVDPPYGIGQNWKKDKTSQFYRHRSEYKNDSIPDKKYFNELFRVSINQIIWGGNYFTQFLPATGAWFFWDKKRSDKTFSAQGELAWASLKIPLRIIPLRWNGFCTCEKRPGIHPHEKPIALYEWILSRCAEPGMKILDTHLGSGSIAIACQEMGYSLVSSEINKNYFNAACKRIKAALGDGDAG